MSDVVIVAIVGAIPGTIAAILGWKNSVKIEQVHKSTNGKMDQLLRTTKAASFQSGRTSGIKKEKKDNKVLVAKAKRK